MILTDTEASQIVLKALNEINQRLINEAIKAWDRVGEGCFAEFIRCYVNKRWLEIVRGN